MASTHTVAPIAARPKVPVIPLGDAHIYLCARSGEATSISHRPDFAPLLIPESDVVARLLGPGFPQDGLHPAVAQALTHLLEAARRTPGGLVGPVCYTAGSTGSRELWARWLAGGDEWLMVVEREARTT